MWKRSSCWEEGRPEYHKLTYDLTTHAAEILAKQNPDMVFCYVFGSGTDSTEKGRIMWARVKGKTENRLLQLPFKRAYMFRPGFMNPTKGLKNTLKLVKAFSWLYPAARALFPGFVCTLREVGIAMIRCATTGYDKPVIEVLSSLCHQYYAFPSTYSLPPPLFRGSLHLSHLYMDLRG